MFSFAHQPLSVLVLLIASAASSAFLTPGTGNASLIKARRCSLDLSHRATMPTRTALCQSSGDDDDGSNTINIALISDNDHDELETTLKNHPLCKMTGTKFSIANVPASSSTEKSPWTEEDISNLEQADIALFDTASAVTSYLNNLDYGHFGIAEDMDDMERRGLPNKPSEDNTATFMAACPNVNSAKECLNSGRWESNHIYYPKETQGAVQLKTEPIAGEDGSDGEEKVEEEEEIDMQIWADAIAQAGADAMERKFWGGGW